MQGVLISIYHHWMFALHSLKQHQPPRSFPLAVRMISNCFLVLNLASFHFLFFVSFDFSLILMISSSSFEYYFAASDYYQFDDLLTSEEQAIRKKVRVCAEKEIAPIMAEVYIYICNSSVY